MTDEIDALLERLRGIYTVPVNDGGGLLNGRDTFTRTFQTPPISHEAADVIDALRAQLAAATDREAALREALDALVVEYVDYATINHLGDPEKQHNIKLARRAIAATDTGDQDGL